MAVVAVGVALEVLEATGVVDRVRRVDLVAGNQNVVAVAVVGSIQRRC